MYIQISYILRMTIGSGGGEAKSTRCEDVI